MTEVYAELATTAWADVLARDRVMDHGIRPLWPGGPRVAGRAFTVSCAPGDNLMLHAAIHRAPAGSVIVCQAGDLDYAVAGGNVCAVAQRNGIAAFVVDGVVRDLGEIRELGFPVFARGIMPKPGRKAVASPLNRPVSCGGVSVAPGDVVVLDEEGAVAVPAAAAGQLLERAREKAAADQAQTLEEWEQAHRSTVDALLLEQGWTG